MSEEWRVVKRPHSYDDGTTHRYAVEYTSDAPISKGAIIQIADWLPEDMACLVAAAPDMLAALQEVMNEWREGYGLRCEKQVRAAIAKATIVDSGR